ncbi:MAG TPA: nitronate monooxygenase [Acidimicrobiales bacterium]|nr:nitronate monooxygenase [Acidimicrobiales bacterium]
MSAAPDAAALFGVELPIVLGPLAGGPSTPALAAAVSAAGGLGTLGEAYVAPEGIRSDIRAVKAATDRPFALNLFVPEDGAPDEAGVERALALLAPYRLELGLGPGAAPAVVREDFDAQLAVVLEEGVAVCTCTFGVPPRPALEALQARGTTVGATVTTPAEAVVAAEAGVDFVIAQGAEAGGHRASFLPVPGDDLIGTMALVPQVRDACGLPVVAAGGMGDGRGVAAALVLGASAAQLGTAFLLCPEAGTSPPYRAALARARAEDTVVTSAFSGRRARGLANRFTRAMAGHDDLPPFPVLNAMTAEIRREAAARGDAGLLSLWAGQMLGELRPWPAADLVAAVAAETAAALGAPGRAGR